MRTIKTYRKVGAFYITYWTRKSRRHPGRPEAAAEIRDLFRL
jgi:hypothetical protein